MSQWKVSKEKIELFSHPNADNLELGKVGAYQVVVQKGLYRPGDEIVFAPEKSVLTGNIKNEFEKYLAGPNKDRIKSIRLRGEISCGIIIPHHLISNIERYEIGEDISEYFSIKKYEPTIPPELMGKVNIFNMPFIGSHDCEHAGIYVNEFVNGERVVITEKLHGSQCLIAHYIETNETILSSKGLLKSGLVIEKSDENTYWVATKNDDIVGKIIRNFESGVIQIFGEVIPIQNGYGYGQSKPTIRIFDIRIDEKSIPYDKVPLEFKKLWVPVVYDGTLSLIEKEVIIFEDNERGIREARIDNILPIDIVNLCQGNEMVSGKSLHNSEGIVIRPYIDRDARDGIKLRLKIISPHYKESGDEIS